MYIKMWVLWYSEHYAILLGHISTKTKNNGSQRSTERIAKAIVFSVQPTGEYRHENDRNAKKEQKKATKITVFTVHKKRGELRNNKSRFL